MKITRALTTIELNEFDHENLCTVLELFNNLKEDLQEHGEDSIQSTVDGEYIDSDELDSIIFYLNIFANTRRFIVA